MSINGGEHSCLVDNLGNFKVEVPSVGHYKLEVFNLNYFFEPVIVEIFAEEFAPGKNIKAFLFSLKQGKDFRLVYPLQLDPSSRIAYFEQEVPFNPISYMKNPFVIMIGVTLLMTQMMKNMDPEEMKTAQASQSDAMKDLPSQCQQQ